MRISFLFLILVISCNSTADKKTSGDSKVIDEVVESKNANNDITQKEKSVKIKNCHLPADAPAHFDPFYNGHLHENFDPKQIDFSKEFFELRTRDSNNFKDEIGNLDCSNVWSDKSSRNGVIGLNYRTISIEFNTVKKIDKYKYFISGNSMVKKNICDFEGNLVIKHVHLYEDSDVPKIKQGTIIGSYEFKENPDQRYSGIFRGIFESAFYFESDSIVKLDNLFESADGYHNNSFVGTWQSYDKAKFKKCIWGDYRLPFTFDYDIGDGEMIINEKYKNN